MNKAFRSLLSLAAMAALLPCAARAETPMGVSSLAEAKALYEHDLAACRNGAVDEDRRTCMEEAKRAYEEARREALQHQHKHTHEGKKTSTP